MKMIGSGSRLYPCDLLSHFPGRPIDTLECTKSSVRTGDSACSKAKITAIIRVRIRPEFMMIGVLILLTITACRSTISQRAIRFCWVTIKSIATGAIPIEARQKTGTAFFNSDCRSGFRPEGYRRNLYRAILRNRHIERFCDNLQIP